MTSTRVHKNRSKVSPRTALAREREAKALEMRKAGMRYAQIGEALGITDVGAYKCVMRAIDKLNNKIAEDAEEVRRLDLERLNEMLESLWPMRHKPTYVDRILRIMERRSRLLGLDAPKSVDVTSGGEPVQVQFVWIDSGPVNDDNSE